MYICMHVGLCTVFVCVYLSIFFFYFFFLRFAILQPYGDKNLIYVILQFL